MNYYTFVRCIQIASVYNKNMSVLIILPFLAGIVVGFLINYLADVLPASMRLGQPVCLHAGCNQPIAWSDYLLLRRCKHCGKPRLLRTFIVLFLSVASALFLWTTFPSKLGFWLSFLSLSYLYVVAVIDLEHRLVLRPLSIAGFLIAAGCGFLLHGWQSTLIGGLAGFAIMFVFYLFGKLFSTVRARRRGEDPKQAEEALGSGDVTLATILGLFLGWPLIWFGLLAGALISGIVSLIVVLFLVIARKYREQAFMVYIPLGPMFIISAILIIFLPQLVLNFLPK